MIKVKNVKHIQDYKLMILFSDDKEKIVDFENLMNQEGFYILPLRDIEFFKKVQMDRFNYSICWPNGADFCPDVLYEMGIEVKKLRQRKELSHHLL